MMPSEASRISSKLLRPSWFSILEMMWMFSPPCAFRCSRISITSERLRIKEAATKSTPCSQPKIRSCLSFSASAGRAMETPGRFTPLFSPRSPLFSTLQITLLPSMAVTSIPIRPSSTSTVLPTDRSVVKPSYVTATISLLPITDLSVVKVKV